ncbi:MAG: PEP-CTERM sorting domain-containing protein [Gemmatales bacterium]
MRPRIVRIFLALLSLHLLIGTLEAQVTPIGPFTGTATEGFNVLPFDPSYQQYSIMGGLGLVRNIHPSGALKYEASSTRGGDTVLPHTGVTFGGQIGISEWTFTQPLAKFGAYWENNSRFDDAVATFYDTSNNLVATLTLNDPKDAQTWTWNGWQFSVPVNKFVITGNDTAFFSGFIWYDDATATFSTAAVPEPASWMLMGAVALGITGYAGYRYRQKIRQERVWGS